MSDGLRLGARARYAMSTSTESRVLVESGFYESQTCAVLKPRRGSKTDFFGLDLAFKCTENEHVSSERPGGPAKLTKHSIQCPRFFVEYAMISTSHRGV
jgi:hypothetical protein